MIHLICSNCGKRLSPPMDPKTRLLAHIITEHAEKTVCRPLNAIVECTCGEYITVGLPDKAKESAARLDKFMRAHESHTPSQRMQA